MKKNNDKKNSTILNAKSCTVTSKPMLLFFKFQCPHCHEQNIMGKTNEGDLVLCTNSGCRKIIILKKFEDIAA